MVGSIAPKNYPLRMAVWKMLPAVAAGNTIVLKPSEMTPITSLMLAEDATAAGMPDGVFNVITGTGPVAGRPSSVTPMRMVSFTGSTRVGHRVAEVAMAGLKRIHLELGGKAPFVVFEDADLEAAIQGRGRREPDQHRPGLHRRDPRLRPPLAVRPVVDGVATVMDGIVLGDTADEGTDIGPLISPPSRRRWRRWWKERSPAARRSPAAVSSPRGTAPSTGRRAGHGRHAGLRDRAEEIFGPVLVALPFDDDDEALRLANDTPYGLAVGLDH